MTRRQIREQIFLLLFSAEFYTKEEMDRQTDLNLRRLEIPDPDSLKYIEAKTRAILKHLDEIDGLINAAAEGWKTSRMGKTELAIIRLAVYEMKYEEEIPISVAINEAVELAKAYSSEQGAAFVNGVLAKLA